MVFGEPARSGAGQVVTPFVPVCPGPRAFRTSGRRPGQTGPPAPSAPSSFSYTYDDEDRLTVEKQLPSSYSTYTYSGDGLRRTAFPAGGSLTTMVWDGTDYLGEY